MPEGMRKQAIIRVHKGQPFALSSLHARIARSGYAAVFLMHDPHARFILGQTVQDRQRIILRSVIYGNKLPILFCLGLNAPYSAHERLPILVARHDDGYKRSVHCGISFFLLSANAASPAFLRST